MFQVQILQDSAAVDEAADSLAPSFTEWISAVVGIGAETQLKLALSVLAVVLVWLLRRLLLGYVYGRFDDAKIRYQWSKTSAYVAFFVAILAISQIWLEAIRQIGTFLGLLSAGLAIALRDVVANLAGWAFVLWRRPFELGDRIEIGETRGDVVDVRIFQFTMLEVGNWVGADQSTGRVVHVPNSKVFTEPVANYTVEFPYIWNEVPVLVTFESDWRKARRILETVVDEVAGEVVEEARNAVRRASRKYLIHYRHVTPIVYTSVQESGVLLTVRYICGARSRRGTEEGIWEKVLDAFDAEPDIDFAYPTRRVYHNLLEGKEEARAQPPGWLSAGDGGSGDGTGRRED